MKKIHWLSVFLTVSLIGALWYSSCEHRRVTQLETRLQLIRSIAGDAGNHDNEIARAEIVNLSN